MRGCLRYVLIGLGALLVLLVVVALFVGEPELADVPDASAQSVASTGTSIAQTEGEQPAPTAIDPSSPTSIPLPPDTPTATNPPPPMPTDTPVTTATQPIGATANNAANLRSGPGTEYDIVGGVGTGDALIIVGRNAAGGWYQLDSGVWIAGFLVENPPGDVAVAEALPLPTATPVPMQESPSNGNVVISNIFYDGVVPRAESDEYAEIRNNGTTAQNLQGWRLNAGDSGQDFIFPSFELAPGQSCRIYTDEFHPEHCGFNFGRGSALWNNNGECGYLYDSSGALVDDYCYD